MSRFRVPVQNDRGRGHRLAPELGYGEEPPAVGRRKKTVPSLSRYEVSREERLRDTGRKAADRPDLDRITFWSGAR